ncbi:MAG: hypothetical protein CML29_16535 [Rhizobiales bacterium]|nr:hypothetical protein [Hyphomicrobiales bacterium]MBA67614.1 hypothetical protein [Hyphomicrobiales bacterium]
MKWFIALWAAPMALICSWYTLSYYDLNFGLTFLSRDLHDLVFIVYGNILGVPPEDVPPMVFKAILVDTALVVAILLLRRKGYTLMSGIKALFGRGRAARELKTTDSAAAPE